MAFPLYIIDMNKVDNIYILTTPITLYESNQRSYIAHRSNYITGIASRSN